MNWIDAPITSYDSHPLGVSVADAVAGLPLLHKAKSGEIVGVRLTGWHTAGSVQAEGPTALAVDGSSLHFHGKLQTEILFEITGEMSPNQRAGLMTLGASTLAHYGNLDLKKLQWAESYADGSGCEMRSIILLHSAILVVDDVHDYTDELDFEDTQKRSHLWIMRPSSRHAQIAQTEELESLRVFYEKLSIRDTAHRGRIGYRQITHP